MENIIDNFTNLEYSVLKVYNKYINNTLKG